MIRDEEAFKAFYKQKLHEAQERRFEEALQNLVLSLREEFRNVRNQTAL